MPTLPKQPATFQLHPLHSQHPLPASNTTCAVVATEGSLRKEVEQNVAGTPKPNRILPVTGGKPSEPNPSWIVQRVAAEQIASEEKAGILDHVKTLREEIQNTKAEIAARKAGLQKRRSEFASATRAV